MRDRAFATVGDNCIDRFLPPVGDWLVGGNAVNVAVQLAGLGCRAAYFGAVGRDVEGRAVRAALEANGVGTDALYLSSSPTARTDIETLPDGERRFVFESFGACLHYSPAASEIALLRRMRHIHIGWLRGAVGLRQALATSGAIVSQDVAVNNRAEDLDPSGLDIAFSSSDPSRGEAESRRLLGAGARLAVVTLGPAGSLANDGVNLRRMAADPVAAIDTTGAGDAFIAGFLDAYSKSLNLQECLAAGSRAGGLACQYRGGFPQVPLQAFVHDTRGASERVLDRD